MGSSTRSLQKWARELESGDSTIAQAAKEALAASGPKAVPLLISLLDANEEKTRLRALSLLALFASPRSARAVAALLHDPSALTRQHAASTLARLASTRSAPALGRLLERESHSKVRTAAVRSLTRLFQTGHQDALSILLQVMTDPEEFPRVRTTALGAIPFMVDGENTHAAKAMLKRLASDPEPMVARKAKKMLEQDLSTKLEPWVLSQLLSDLGKRRLPVWRRALALLGRGGSEIVDGLLEALLARPNDKQYGRRCALVLKSLSPRRLGKIGPYLDVVEDPIPLLVLVEVAEEAGSGQLMARVAALIKRLASGPEEDGPGPHDMVRQRAHLTLAMDGSRIAAEDLRFLLEDERYPVRGELVEAASLIATRAEFRSLLRAYLRCRGVTRLAVRDAVLNVAQREKIRRTDQMLLLLEDAEQRAAREILGFPRNKRQRPRRRIDSLSQPLLP